LLSLAVTVVVGKTGRGGGHCKPSILCRSRRDMHECWGPRLREQTRCVVGKWGCCCFFSCWCWGVQNVEGERVALGLGCARTTEIGPIRNRNLILWPLANVVAWLLVNLQGTSQRIPLSILIHMPWHPQQSRFRAHHSVRMGSVVRSVCKE